MTVEIAILFTKKIVSNIYIHTKKPNVTRFIFTNNRKHCFLSSLLFSFLWGVTLPLLCVFNRTSFLHTLYRIQIYSTQIIKESLSQTFKVNKNCFLDYVLTINVVAWFSYVDVADENGRTKWRCSCHFQFYCLVFRLLLIIKSMSIKLIFGEILFVNKYIFNILCLNYVNSMGHLITLFSVSKKFLTENTKNTLRNAACFITQLLRP